jgi:(E)-4-hydroxy-3-methyl-but-2-enyl pyrophosphate reductase
LRIILAKTAGFCMGVKRAMEEVLDIARHTKGPLYTYGPLIHNRQAVEMLESRGIEARTDFQGREQGTVLLRTHGVPPDIVQDLRDCGLTVEDGTCPHVLRGQRSIARRSAEGYHVVIVGDRDHDEVVGLAGHARNGCDIIATVEEARTVPLAGKVLVVAQTTFEEALFRQIAQILKERHRDVEVVESICNATSERQAEARELASRVDAMVVVGGYHSANTCRLAEIAESTGTPTFHVETAADLDAEKLAAYQTVGVTAGASTPSWTTSTVIDKLRSIGESRSRWARLGSAVVNVVMDANLYVAGGAAALTYAASKLIGLQPETRWQRASLMIAAFGYIFAAYSLGRRAESQSSEASVTRRGAFYAAHSMAIGVASVLLLGLAVAVLVPFGAAAVILLGVSYTMAACYSQLLSPRGTGHLAWLRNVPASKDILVALGWMVATVIIPAVAVGGASTASVLVVALWVFGLALIRSEMFDFSDVMADRLLGRDTLPALIGVTRARRLLTALVAALVLLIAFSVAAGVMHGPGYWMLLCPAYVLCYLLAYDRVITSSEHLCGLVVDGGMWLAGLIALVHAFWA